MHFLDALAPPADEFSSDSYQLGGRSQPGELSDRGSVSPRGRSDRGGFGIEPTSDLFDPLRSTPEQPTGADFELGPDFYRDHDRGTARDLHDFGPSPAGVDGPGLGIDHRVDRPEQLRPEQRRPEQRRPEERRPEERRPEERRPEERWPEEQRPEQEPAVLGGAWQRSPEITGEHDDAATSPLPVILPGATTLPRPAPVEAPRGFFEPPRPSQQSARPASVTGSVEPPPATFAVGPPPGAPWPPPAPREIPAAAAAKLDQIKDLYLTAEAIGEDALDKHFDQVSQRQRDLIREFFERSKQNGDAAPG